MNWEFHSFQSLDTHRLFALMKLRTDVFIVEQQCAYPELDSFDNQANTIHLLGFDQHTLVAYARAMPITVNKDEHSIASVRIGRVVVSKSHRGTGLADQLMKCIISQVARTYPGKDQVLSAQEPVVRFYAKHGFKQESEAYLEDGIPHVAMRRSKKSAVAHPPPDQSSGLAPTRPG